MSNVKRNERVVRDMKKLLAKLPPNGKIPNNNDPTPKDWIIWFLDFFVGHAELEMVNMDTSIDLSKTPDKASQIIIDEGAPPPIERVKLKHGK